MKNTYKKIIGLGLAVFIFSISGLVVNAETMVPNIYRHEGYSRENVAENVAADHFSDANKVIIVNRDKFADAISATNISQGRYPVLYTHQNKVNNETIELLKSMPLNEIYILGGEFSVSESVVSQLNAEINVPISRVAGRSRYDANVSAVRTIFSQSDHVVIASGEVFADALYGVSYANTIKAPVVLTNTNNLHESTEGLLKRLQVKEATIIGGTLTVTPEVEEQLEDLDIQVNRIAGRSRYIGSAEVANASYSNPENVVIASGEVFSDALVSAPLAQKLDAPILLTRANDFEPVIEEYLKTALPSLDNAYIQGGPLTISYTILRDVLDQQEEDLRLYGFWGEAEQIDLGLLNFEILKLINTERERLGVQPLTYAPELQRGANIRANEITTNFSYTRPDGSNYNTVHSNVNLLHFTERIAYYGGVYLSDSMTLEQSYAEFFYRANYENADRYRVMTNPDHTDFAISVSHNQNARAYPVQHFGILTK